MQRSPSARLILSHSDGKYGPQRAIETVRKALQQAQLRGEVDIDEPAVVARQFVAMLRGDIHLGVLFGLRNCPDATEIHVHVKTVVDLLLNGAVAADLSALKPTPRHRCSVASRFAIHRHLEGCLEEAVTLRATRKQRTHRCLLQRLARLIKNERRNTRTITSPYAARSSQENRDSVGKSTSTLLDRT
jgi:hypothetical protein